MSDLYHVFGQDFAVDGTGDVALVDGADNTAQTFAHRLLTALGGYIWQLDYGTGLPAQVGQVVDLSDLQAMVSAQAALEAGIDQTQPVVVTPVQATNGNGVNLQISYTNSATGLAQVFLLGD